MKEIYQELGIDEKVFAYGQKFEETLKERFEEIDKTAEYNQLKVIKAMQKCRVGAECFMGSNGVSLARGVTTPNVLEAEVKRNMMQNSREQYLLADSSKFGRILLFKVADMNEIDCLITDSQADEEIIAKIRNLGVTVY